MNSGALFEVFFGQGTDTNTSADYKHIFVDTGSNLLLDNSSSFSLQENFNSTSDVTMKYTGCKLNTLSVSLNNNETLNFTSNWFGSEVLNGSVIGTQVTTTTQPLTFAQATLSTGTLASEATVGLVKSFNIEFNNNIDVNDAKGFGSRLNQELVLKNLDVSVEFTKQFQTVTEFERFLGGTSPTTTTPTDTSLILQVTNGVTLGNGRVEFFVQLTGGQYESMSHNVSQDGVVEETFNYVGGVINQIYFIDSVATYF